MEEDFRCSGTTEGPDGTACYRSFGLVTRLNAKNSQEKVTAKYPDLFTGLGTLEGEYRIKLKEDAKPFALTTSRRVALLLLPEELEQMEGLGVIAHFYLNAWYLDDGTLIGPFRGSGYRSPNCGDGPSLGLYRNRSKSLLLISEEVDSSQSPLPPDIPVARRGFYLLGCPIGYCEDSFQARLAKVKGFPECSARSW